jgi:hypothetical protein
MATRRKISKEERERREALMSRVNEGCVWCFHHLITDGMPVASVAQLYNEVLRYVADTAMYYQTMRPTELGMSAYYHFRHKETDNASDTEPSNRCPV